MVSTAGTPRAQLSDLQSSIRSLVNERRVLQARLTQARKKRPFQYAGFAPKQDDQGNDPFQENGRQTLPGMDSKDSVGGAPDEKAAGPKADVYQVEKRPKISLDDSTLKRSKNMFGSLLGHLQKAKSQLDVEKMQRPAELQRAVTQQVDHMLELEKKNLAELRRRDFQERQKKDLARMRELQKELREKEALVLEVHLQQHFGVMKNFIHTTVTPMIFWMPAVHNETTEKLHQATVQSIERKLESIVEKFSSPQEEKWQLDRALEDNAQEQQTSDPFNDPMQVPLEDEGHLEVSLDLNDAEETQHSRQNLTDPESSTDALQKHSEV